VGLLRLARKADEMLFILTNDDGIDALGLRALE
jgi:hypothetical protein